MNIQTSIEEIHIRKALYIQKDIDSLPDNLRAIFDTCITKDGYTQESALKEALIYEDINNLPPELKAIAEKYLSEGAFQTKAWNEVQVHLTIEQLPAHYKSIVNEYLSMDFSHSTALRKAKEKTRGLAQEKSKAIIHSL